MPRASTLIARPALRRLPTRPSRLVQGLIQRVLPRLFWLQGLELRSGNAAQGLAEAFAAQQAGESTLLIAFRHPSTRDPLVLADLFWNRIPAEAVALLQPLPRPVELRFLYDRGIPIWADSTVQPLPRPVPRWCRAAMPWWSHRKAPPTISPERWRR